MSDLTSGSKQVWTNLIISAPRVFACGLRRDFASRARPVFAGRVIHLAIAILAARITDLSGALPKRGPKFLK
jgi:hypothetical protein